MHLFLRYTLAALLFLLSACGPTRTPPVQGPARASLVVHNQFPFPLEIAVDGWRVGTIPALSVHRYENLRPGMRLLTAVGQDTSLEDKRQLTAAKAHVWHAHAHGSQPVPLPALGALQISNPTPFDVEISHHDDVLTLLSGDTREVLHLDPGPFTFIVRVISTKYERSQTVEVQSDTTSHTNIEIEVGQLVVSNNTKEPVRVALDGKAVGQIENEATLTVSNVLIGTHRLRAVGMHTGRRYHRQVAFTVGNPLRWDLASASGNVEIVNFTGEPLEVSIGTEVRGTLPPDQALKVENARLGQRVVRAIGAKTNHQWTATLAVVADQYTVWAVRNDVATLVIENQRPETVRVYAAKQLLAEVPKGKRAVVSQLSLDTVTLDVFGVASKRVDQHAITLTPERSSLLKLDQPECAMRVHNETLEPVMVYLNRRPVGRLQSQSELVFTQTPPGHHRIEARGLRTGNVIRGEVTLTPDAQVSWSVQNATGTIQIRNETGERLLLPPSLAVEKPSIESGQTESFVVPVGRRAFKLVGTRSGESYGTRRLILEGEAAEWVIPRLEGILHIFNRTNDSYRVTIRDQPQIEVLAQSSKKVSLRSGRHVVQATAVGKSDAVERSVRIRANVSTPYELRPALARFSVNNRSTERIDLRIDGAYLGAIDAGSRRSYTGWRPGEYELSAQGNVSHAIQTVRLRLRGSALETWTVFAAEGALLVENERNETLRILLDGRELGTVKANSARRVELSVGPHLIELVGLESKAHFRYRLKIKADQTITTVCPTGPAALQVINTLKIPISVAVGERILGTVPSSKEGSFLIYERGVLDFRATPAETTDGPTYYRRLRYQEDSLQTWRLQP